MFDVEAWLAQEIADWKKITEEVKIKLGSTLALLDPEARTRSSLS